jgi:hypothetical protein
VKRALVVISEKKKGRAEGNFSGGPCCEGRK